MVLSAVSPVYDESGTALGAVGMDISMVHMTEVMSGYKIGRGGYILLLSQNGTFLYHPQSDIIQKNIADIKISLSYFPSNHCCAGTDIKSHPDPANFSIIDFNSFIMQLLSSWQSPVFNFFTLSTT